MTPTSIIKNKNIQSLLMQSGISLFQAKQAGKLRDLDDLMKWATTSHQSTKLLSTITAESGSIDTLIDIITNLTNISKDVVRKAFSNITAKNKILDNDLEIIDSDDNLSERIDNIETLLMELLNNTKITK